MTMDINKNKGLMVALAAAVVALLVATMLWRSAVNAGRAAAAESSAVISQYETITRKYQGEPGQKLVDLYKQKLQEAKDAAVAMHATVSEEAEPKYTPSQFKERVRSSVDTLIKEAKQGTIAVPEDLGFGPIYSGSEMPAARDMPGLISQYLIICDVTRVLLSNKVIKIDAIDRNVEAKPVEGGDDIPVTGPVETKEKPVFESVPVQFRFATTPEKLYPILAGIRNKHQFYRVRLVNVPGLEPIAVGEGKSPSDIREELSAEVTVERVVLAKDEPKAATAAAKESVPNE